MTTREALIEAAYKRADHRAVVTLSAMSDEQVDAVLASFAKWGKEVGEVAEQMYAAAGRALAPLAALAEKYRDAA